MKALYIAGLLFVLTAFSRADNVSDAALAFQTMLEYQRTDDPRLVDLFHKDVCVIYRLTDGVNYLDKVKPPEDFFKEMEEDLSRKYGNTNTYKNIIIKEIDRRIIVCCMVNRLFTNSEPLQIEYTKSPEGLLKIAKVISTNRVNVMPLK